MQVTVVGLGLEFHLSDVLHELDHLWWAVLAKFFDRYLFLLLYDIFLVLLLSSLLDELLLVGFGVLHVNCVHLGLGNVPWKSTHVEKVDYDIAEGFQVITPAVFCSQMCLERQILNCTYDTFIISVCDVLASLWVEVALTKSEIDEVDDVGLLSLSYADVFRLHVPMDEVVGVHDLKPAKDLVENVADRGHRELLVTELEQLHQVWPQDAHNHAIELPFYTKVVDRGYAGFVSLSLISFTYGFPINAGRFLTRNVIAVLAS